MSKLASPDKKCCQAKPNGPFRMGGPPFTRCSNKPAFIVKERKPGDDGKRGSMSLCATCYVVFLKQCGTEHADVVWEAER